MYCHGGKTPKAKGPEDGCAVLWRVWGGVGYYAEEIAFMEAFNSQPPGHWTRADKRLAHRIKVELAALEAQEKQER